MNFILNAKVKTKLLFMSGISLAFLLILGLVGFYYLQDSNSKVNSMYKDKLLAIEYLEESKNVYNSLNSDLFELMITTDDNRNNQLKQDISAKKDQLAKNMNEYANKELDPFEVTTYNAYKQNSEKAVSIKDDVQSLALANKNAEAYAEYTNKLNTLNNEIGKDLSSLTDYNIKDASQLKQDNEAGYQKARIIIILIEIFALVLVGVISIAITNIISSTIRSFELYVEKVAAGDLSEETMIKAQTVKIYDDEIGKLGKALFEMRGRLWTLISKMSEASEQIAASSEELNANAEESSKGVEDTAEAVNKIAEAAEKQLSSVEETSRAIQNITGSMQQVASNTTDTSKVAEKTLEATNDGGKAIDTTKNQMSNIERIVTKLDGVVKILGQRSSEIGEIVETISSIAEQTNLLALNAAIEAARAGEQGKGFAVVADEVRKLAESSQEATGKISELIGHIQQDTGSAVSSMQEGTTQVRIGIEVVDKAGQTFKDISDLVGQIASQIQEVAAASENISQESDQVIVSIDRVDKESKTASEKSQSIAASIEEQSAAMNEIANASEGLAKIGESLMTEISKFKL